MEGTLAFLLMSVRWRNVAYWPIATEIHVPWNVGDQGESGLVVLNMSFVAHDP